MGKSVDFTIEKYATFRKNIIKKQNSVVVNLTGYTAAMTIKESYTATTTALSLTTENGGLTITGAEGKIAILITADQTSAFTIEKGVFDLKLFAPAAGDEERLIEGKITIKPGVTP